MGRVGERSLNLKPIGSVQSPGTYAMLCPIGGPKGIHYELGQLEEFDIG